MVAADELVGVLALRMPASAGSTPEEREIAASIAGQTAVAIKKVQLIDRLTERNAIKDLPRGSVARARAAPRELARAGRGAGLRSVASRTSCCRRVPRPGPAEPAGRRSPRRSRRRRRGHSRGRCSTGATRRCAGSCGCAAGDEADGRRAACARSTPGSTPKHPLAIGLSNRCEGAPAPIRPGSSEAEHAVAAASVVSASPASSASTTWARTSTCCRCRRTAACATAAARRCSSWPSTTAATARSCC